MDNDFKWGDLRFLLALDRFGGVSQAATHLGTSHQTVSRTLKSLETRLGTRLIDSSTRNWRLTHKGQEILALAVQMEQLAHSVTRQSRSEITPFSGHVTIASVAWGMELIVMPALKQVSTRYPNISFDLISDDGLQSIEAGDADIALRFTANPPDDLIGRNIGPIHLSLYGVPDLIEPLAQNKTDHLPVIEVTHGGAHLRPWRSWPKPPLRVIKVNDLQTMLLAAQNGLGIAVLPDVVADTCPRLIRDQAHRFSSPNKAWLLRHQHSRRSQSIKAVETALIEIGHRILGGQNIPM